MMKELLAIANFNLIILPPADTEERRWWINIATQKHDAQQTNQKHKPKL